MSILWILQSSVSRFFCLEASFYWKKDMTFRNFGASGAITLATYYDIPILVRKSMLKDIKKHKLKKLILKVKD